MKSKEIMKIFMKQVTISAIAYLTWKGLKTVVKKADKAVTDWLYDDPNYEDDAQAGCQCVCHGRCADESVDCDGCHGCTDDEDGYIVTDDYEDSFYAGAKFGQELTIQVMEKLADSMAWLLGLFDKNHE